MVQTVIENLKTKVTMCKEALTQSLINHTEKTQEADRLYGRESIKTQTISVQYATYIIHALSDMVIAYSKYVKVLEKELSKKSRKKTKHDSKRAQKSL